MDHQENTPPPSPGGANNPPTMEKWWIAVKGQAEGPHTPAYIAILLNEGRIRMNAKVCQVGQNNWISLSQAAEIMAVVQKQAPGFLPPTVSYSGFLRKVTNPALPWFANWICIYCILVMPAFFVLNLILTVVGFNTAADLIPESPVLLHAIGIDAVTFIVDAALTVALVVSGLQLLNLQRKAVWLLKLGFVLHLIWGAASILFSILWDAILTLAQQAQPTTEEASIGLFLLFLLLFGILLGLVIFEIAALVWLHFNEDRLPLKDLEQVQHLGNEDQSNTSPA